MFLAATNVVLNKTGTANGTVSMGGSGLATRTVTISGVTGDGTLGISLTTNTVYDNGLQSAVPTGPSVTFIVDNTPPTVAVSAPSVSTTATGPVTFTVTYADANFSASTLVPANITLNKTGTANGTVAVTGTGLTRTVTISGITGDGTLGITVGAGTAKDTAGNLAPASGPSATFTVTQPNTAPTVANAIANFSVNEDAFNRVVDLTTVFTDAETPAASLMYSVVGNTNVGLVTATITSLTNLTMAWTANSNGTSEISVKATDAGGLSVTNTFVVTVTPVNDAPVVTLATNAVVAYGDGTARTNAGFASAVVGPPDEAGQTMSYTVTADNPGLFSVAPAIDSAGTLTFTPLARTNGATRVVVVGQDSGGTANG
ncbi:MAG: hypothetical protein EBS05_25645, partial [Proteobacteria bacterium]|nr:hypothetical protein [Pseudomonadota bacterium]